MTAVAEPVTEKPAKGKKTPAWQDPDRLPQTVESLEAALADARAEAEKLEKHYTWPGEKGYDEHQANVAAADKAIADIGQRIETLRVKAIPLPEPVAATANYELRSIPINQIVVTGNHREDDNPAENERLARSLFVLGIQQPIGLRVAGIGSYELIFGSRRRRAALALGWTEIQAKVYPMELTPLQVELLRTAENFGRKDLSAVEKVVAVGRCHDAAKAGLEPLATALRDVVGDPSPDRYARVLLHVANHDVQVDAATRPALDLAKVIVAAGGLEAYIGQQLGYSAAWVKDHSYIARLGGETRKLLAAGRLSLAHARELAKLGDAEECDLLAGQVAKDPEGLGGDSVEDTRRAVIERLKSLKTVPWRLDVAFGRDEEGCTGYACTTCRFNSRSDPDLFGGTLADEPAAGFCTHPTCFAAKKTIAERDLVKLTKDGKALVKKTGQPATETTLGGMVASTAVHVKPAVVARAVKREIEQGPKPTAAEALKRTPEQIAQEKFREAERKWMATAAKKLNGAMAENPGSLLLFSLAKFRAAAWHESRPPYDNNPKGYGKALAAAKSKEFANMAKAIARASLSDFIDLEDKSRDSISHYEVQNQVPEAIVVLAEAFGLKLDPLPTVEQFLKSDKSDTKPAKPAATKPATKGGKAGKKPKPTDDDDSDDE